MRQALFLFVVLCLPLRAWADFELPFVPQPPPQQTGQPWSLSVRAFTGYNNNVNYVPNATTFVGSTTSPYVGAQLNAAYRVALNSQFTLGGALTVQTVAFTASQKNSNPDVNDDANDYDFWTATPTLFGQYRFSLLGRPAELGLAYAYHHEEAANIHSIGLNSHNVTLNFSIAPCPKLPDLTTGIAATFGHDDYGVKFPDMSLNSRDANRYGMDVFARYQWDHGIRNVMLTYSFLDNDAEGSNFDYLANGISLRFETQIYGPIWGAASFGFRHGDYRGFQSGFIPAPGRMYQDVFDYDVQLMYVVNRHLSFDVYYHHGDVTSNQPEFATEQNDVGMGVTYSF